MKSGNHLDHWIFVFLFISSMAVRLAIGIGFINPFDLVPYNIPWAVGVYENGFSMYKALDHLDYPPLFPSLLGLVGKGVKAAQAGEYWHLLMGWIKLVPILGDGILMICVYAAARKTMPRLACVIAGFVGLCGAFLVNSAFWGQADSWMLCFVFLMVWKLEERCPKQAAVFFALGCLTKLQTGYFAPFLLLILFFEYPFKKAVSAVLLGGAVGLLGWLPFWIASGRLWLPFEIYFGGFGSYPYQNLNAFNLYGLWGRNWVLDSQTWIGNITYAQLSGGITLLFAAGVPLFCCILTQRTGRTILPSACGFLMMNGIFLFACRMHERYQLPAVICALAAFLFTKQRAYLFLFFGVSTVSFFNQVLLLFAMNYKEPFYSFFYQLQPWLSAVNLGLFLIQFVVFVSKNTNSFEILRKIPGLGKSRGYKTIQ
ncbi:MAG: hypothetical protein ACOX60_10935 [Massiliimalia sp.]